MFIGNQNFYPLYSFPPRVYAAAMETAKIAQVTDIIAGTACLTALSIAVAPNADWKHPLSGQVRPSVLNQAIAAISGDRKSSADELVCRPIYDHDAVAVVAKDEEARAYAKAKGRWIAIKKGLLSRIAKFASAGEPTEEIDAQLEAHEALEPSKPTVRRIIYQDMTRVSAFEALEGNGKAIAMLTDEGHTLLDSTVMRHYGFLNHAWDGKQLLTYDRANHESIVVQNPRVTVSFMIQPEVLANFFARRGKIVHGSGFCARYLFSRSPSMMGHREPKLSTPLVDLLPFHARIQELLSAYQKIVSTNKIIRDILEFDDEARTLWLQIAGKVETDFLPGYFLNDISDFGNKYMDIVGRIACLMHYFEADTADLPSDPDVRAAKLGQISADTLSRAEQVAAWHLNEYKQLFSPPPQRPPEAVDAEKVYSYLYRNFHLPRVGEVPKNHVRQNCGIRDISRLHRALRLLVERRAIWIKQELYGNSKKPTEVIALIEEYFNSAPIY